jgi:hypothetical protein
MATVPDNDQHTKNVTFARIQMPSIVQPTRSMYIQESELQQALV